MDQRINLIDPEILKNPYPLYAELRRSRPVCQVDPGGLWAITRHADIRRISRDPATFCSGKGVMFFDAPPEMFEATTSFIAMDAPRHTKLRGLVSSAFTPRRVARLEENIAANAERVVSELLEHKEGDFVQVCAKQLPMLTIGEMIGVADDADKEKLQLAA